MRGLFCAVHCYQAMGTKHLQSFTEKVYGVVVAIHKGDVLTYKQVAEKAGNPRASRAVGNILNKNHNPAIPCHRVVRSDGKLGGYNRGEKAKERILMGEGAVSLPRRLRRQ